MAVLTQFHDNGLLFNPLNE